MSEGYTKATHESGVITCLTSGDVVLPERTNIGQHLEQ